MRYLTAKNIIHLPKPDPSTFSDELLQQFRNMPLPDLVQEDLRVPPAVRATAAEELADETDLSNMPALESAENEPDERGVVVAEPEDIALERAMEEAARNAAAAVAASRGAEATRLASATQRGVEAALNQPIAPASVVVPPPVPIPSADEAPGPLAQGAYSEAPTQIQIVQNVPLLPVGTTVLGAPGPGGQPTLIVDTSRSAMTSQGLPGLELPPAARPNSGPRERVLGRNATRRLPRQNNGPSAVLSGAPGAPPPAASARVMVQKLGS